MPMFSSEPLTSFIPSTTRIASVQASPSSGDFNAGDVITVTVVMTNPVTVVGNPTLSFNSGGTGVFGGGGGGGGGGGLPTGLLQSTPAASMVFEFNQSGSGVANGDGTNGYSSFGGYGLLQLWWNCPASQYYQFVVPAFSPSWPGGQANALMVCIDQIPIQADNGNQSNLNYYLNFVTNPSPSVNYSYTAPVTAGWHSIQIKVSFINSGYTLAGIANNNTHVDRLNIIGTGTPLPAEPSPQTRDPGKFPMSSYHFINTPFGANATWLALNNPIAQVINGTGGNGASIGLGTDTTNLWRGQASDPVWNVNTSGPAPLIGQITFPTPEANIAYPVRIPAGMYPSFGGDAGLTFYDATNPRFIYTGFGEFGVFARTDNAGTLAVQDSYNLNSASPQDFLNGYGDITLDDLDSGVIAHRINGGLAAYTGALNVGYGKAQQTSKFSGLPWPGCSSDHDWNPPTNRYGNPVGPPYNCVIGIPPNIAKPGGLNAATSMAWDCMQHYGMWLNVSAGSQNTPAITTYVEAAAVSHPMVTGISWSTIVPNLSVLSNPAPIVPGQGYGGGAPIVALLPGLAQTGIANVSPGLQPAYPSLGKSPYAFPASPVGIPIQVSGRSGSSSDPSGSPSTNKATINVPAGSSVFVMIMTDGATANASWLTPGHDSAGNSYTIVQPVYNGATYLGMLAFCLNTTNPIVAGSTTWTFQESAHQVFWSMAGAFYRPAPPSGTTSLRASGSAISGSNVTTLSVPLAGVQVGDLIISYAVTTKFNEIANPAGFSSLMPMPPINFGFQIATSAGTLTVNPTWATPSPAVLVAAAFANANIAS